MTATPQTAVAVPVAGRRLLPDPWLAGVVAIAVVLAAPVMVVFASVAFPKDEVWQHLATTVLPAYIANSLWLMLGVGIGVAVIGVATAWLVTMTEFPGARLFDWLLLLPLAVPAYVIGYTYTGLLEFAGPVQSSLRAAFGWARQDYWFPEIRSLEGAIVMLTLVLYPYVYLLTRAAFLAQSVCALEVSRTLGHGPWSSFFGVALPLARPAIVAGVALALMETLSDFGTVQYFAVDTFTTGIYRTWLGLGEPLAASQLAAMLLGFILVLVLIERWSRGDRRFHHTSSYYRRLPRPHLHGARAGIAIAVCALPVLLGFGVPALALLLWTLDNLQLALSIPFLTLARNSVLLAAAAAALAVALALPIAYGLRLHGSPLMAAAARIVGLGYAVPGAVIAVGVMLPFVWLDNAVDDLMRRSFGVSTGLILSGTLVAVLFGYVVRFLSLALNSVEAGLAKVTRNMDAAARTLGAGPGATLARIHAPLIGGSLLAAATLVFVDVMKELPATLLMRPFNFDTLAVRTYQLAADERLAEAAAPALAIVAAGILPVIMLSRAVARSRPGHG